MRIAVGVIPGEAGRRADGTAITDMGTLTAIADSLTQSRHAVVAMYSAA
jgi:hypothetical protein